jgi:hypothetical protein
VALRWEKEKGIASNRAISVLWEHSTVSCLSTTANLAGHEIVKVAALEWIFFQGEGFVGAQVVDPDLLCAGSLAAGCGRRLSEFEFRRDPLSVLGYAEIPAWQRWERF